MTHASLALLTMAAVGGAAWWCCVRLPVTADECWHLLVVRRTMQGRRLYRGVFFGAGPWSVWAARAVARRAGVRVLAMRRVEALLTATLAAAVLGWSLAGGLAPPVALAAALGSALLSSALWPLDNHYGLWGRLGAVTACTAAVAADTSTGGAWWGAVAGLGLVMALASKYTLGGVATLAVLATGVVARTWTATLVALLTAAVGAGVVYAVAARGGVARPLVQRLLRNKTSFVSTGGSGFLSGWRESLTGAAEPRSAGRAAWAGYALTVVGGVLVGVDAVRAAAFGQHRAESVATVGLALVAAAALWPRADPVHVRNVAPLWVGVAVVAAGRWSPDLAALVAAVVLLAGLGALVVALRERSRFRPAPPTGGPLDGLDPAPWDVEGIAASAADLRAITGGSVFLLRPDAAVWYLLSGLRNPTPYDYPFASTFGPTGQQQLAANLSSGRVRFCCWVPANAGPLTPVVLEDCVTGLPVVARIGAGTVVTAR